MKKLIALMVSLGLITTMSLTSFAAVTVTPAEGDAITINAAATDEAGVYTFDEATTTFTTTLDEESGVTSDNGQTTILAIAGYDGTAASITTTSIQYINQGAEKNFTFALKEGLITNDNPNATVTILMGGDSMPAATPVATVATLTIATVDDEGGEDAETITISGTVSGYVGATLPTVIVTDGTTEYPASVSNDGAFTVEVPVLSTGSYTLKATKSAHLKYSKANITTATVVNATIKAGDMNSDDIANVTDMGLIVDNYNAEVGSDKYNSAYDVNEDGILNVTDMGLVVDNYNAESISE